MMCGIYLCYNFVEVRVLNAKEIGSRIKVIRTSANYTQAQLSNLVHVSESYIALIELGKRNPSLEVLASIAEKLGTTLDFLVLGENDDNSELYREWQHMMENHSQQEVRSAHVLVKEFFDCLESNRN